MFILPTPSAHESRRTKRRNQPRAAAPTTRRLLLEQLEARWLLTSISGAITSDTTWNNTVEEYVIVGNVTVSPNVTLTIVPGVTVRTQSSTRDIFIDGTVRANGVNFTGSTELIVQNGGTLELSNSSVAGEAVEYKFGGRGWISGSQFSTAQLKLFSKAFSSVTATTFQRTEPVNIDPTLVPKLYGNAFAPNTTILVKGQVDANTEWRVDGNLARYRVDNYWFQVNAGATLTVSPGVEVIGDRSYDSNIYGTLFAASANFTGTTRMVVRNGGRLDLVSCNVAGNRIEYKAGALGQIVDTHFTSAMLELYSMGVSSITGTTFSLAEPVDASPTLIEKLYGNTFAPNSTVLVTGAVTGNTEWRVDGNLARYRVDNYWFQVNAGATLIVGSGVEVNGHRSYDSNIYGTLIATSANFTGTTRMVVRNGGRLNLNNCEVAGTKVQYLSGSLGQVATTRFATPFYIDSGSSAAVTNSSFENAPNVYATGNPAAEIDMTQNWWGTTVPAFIDAKIVDRLDAPTSRPLVLYQPFLTSWPPVSSSFLSIAALDAIKPEGNSGTTPFTFVVTRSGATSGTASVNWSVAGSGPNPANAADFAGGTWPAGTLTFLAGETSKTITVPVAGDTTVEPDEGFTVTLSSAVNAQIGTATAVGTILNDDSVSATILVTNTNDSGPGSLRQAILDANSHPDRNTIGFTIAGTAPHRIRPTSPLPAITAAVVIDGTTEPAFAGQPVIELNGGYVGEGVKGLVITAGNSEVRGLVINGFSDFGLVLETNGDNLVHGNYIGTTTDGTGVVEANMMGILVHGSARNRIEGNLISATRLGISLDGADDNRIQGNLIGTDVSGTTALGNAWGVTLSNGSDNNQIGGDFADAANRIAFNYFAGVAVFSGTGNSILGNSIYANGWLGIDLWPRDVTENDADDSDTGPNDLQNFPVLQSISVADNRTTIYGILQSRPNTTYRVEFFSNITADPSGHGEGESFLGFHTITTGGTGIAAFEAVFDVAVPTDRVVAATATVDLGGGNFGSTSEFSEVMQVSTASSILSIAAADAVKFEGNSGTTPFTFVVTRSGATSGTATANWAVTGTGSNPANAEDFASGTLPSGVLAFSSNETSKTITVFVAGDTVVEPDETFVVTLYGAVGAQIGTGTAVGIILNDDPLSPGLVTNTNDSGPGSLRQAILDANASPGRDTIRFEIPGSGPHTIRPSSPLPWLNDPVVIDATTQPGYAGTPLIELDGSQAGYAHGLVIEAAESLIRGLAINRFAGMGVIITGANATRNVVQSNFIGTNTTGSAALGNGHHGIWIVNGAQENIIGTDGDGVNDALEGNLISGNAWDNIAIEGAGTARNVVAGNRLGTSASGLASLEGGTGVIIVGGAKHNRVGTNADGVGDLAERNIISGHRWNGVMIAGPGTDDNVVAGNFIGVGADGQTALPNNHGIRIEQGAQRNRIGTAGSGLHDTAERNVVSGNTIDGILIIDSGTDANIVAGNFVGVDYSGTVAVPNGFSGIGVARGARGNRIGTDGNGVADAAEANVASGNGYYGISLADAGTAENTVAGNFIGTDLSGMHPLGNAQAGVLIINGAASNRIGTNGDGLADVSERNIISGNPANGVLISGAASNENVVAGNYIGVGADGQTAVGNTHGVRIEHGAQRNRIGTDGSGLHDAAERNIISGNFINGILIIDSANANVIAGNFIGVDSSGTMAVPNGFSGICVARGASGNRIGTNASGIADAAEANVISANGYSGVALVDVGTAENILAGNWIGTDLSGTRALGNGLVGVEIRGAIQNRIGGPTAAEGNRIAFNGGEGIYLRETWGNSLLGNSIYANIGLGIDLDRDGVTLNDPGDLDQGANGRQNFPVLQSATSAANQLSISGALNSRPNATYRIEFFSNAVPHSSGYGQGEVYLGAVNIATDGSGNATFSTSFQVSVSGERYITATATDGQGNTSEFSQAILAANTGGPAFIMADIAGRVGGNGSWWVAESTGSQFANELWGRWGTGVNWKHVLVGDFTGDGYDDIAGQTPNGDWWVARSTGTGFVNEHWGRWNPGGGWSEVRVGDFNGDGRADIIGRTAGGDWWVALSTGSGFVNEHWGRWSTATNWTDIHVGDFTGDGLADLAGRTASNGDWWIARSTSSGFVNERWGRWSTATDWTDIQVGDFTGDGLADLAGRTANSGDWWIARSTGDGFVNERWGRWSIATAWTDIQVGDFTGDGLADLAGRTANSGDWWIARSTGSGFVNERWGRWSTATDWTDIRVGDFTGDGLADLAGRTANNGDWWIARSTGDGFVNERWGRWSTGVDWEQVLVGNFAPAAAAMQAAFAPPVDQPAPQSLAQVELDPVVAAAVLRLPAELQNIAFQVQIANLPGLMLGQTMGNTILIDHNAAGFGWFVDLTPWDDAEFSRDGGTNGWLARPGGDADGRMDLLTVVMHELGHLLGYDHSDTGLMSEALAPGVRHLWDDRLLDELLDNPLADAQVDDLFAVL